LGFNNAPLLEEVFPPNVDRAKEFQPIKISSGDLLMHSPRSHVAMLFSQGFKEEVD
jgi:hypothetical protein